MNIRIFGLSAAAAILVAGCGTAQQAARTTPASHPAPAVTKTVQAPQPTPTVKITVTPATGTGSSRPAREFVAGYQSQSRRLAPLGRP